MFIEILPKTIQTSTREVLMESFEFIFTDKISENNSFLDLSKFVPENIENVLKKKLNEKMGYVNFNKEGTVFDSSAFYPFGNSFNQYLRQKESGEKLDSGNLYKNLKGFNIPKKLNKEVIKLLKEKYPNSFVVHKSPNVFRKKQLEGINIKKNKEYKLKEYLELISK